MSKSLELYCSREICERIVTAMRKYAEAAYPAGGSDCAQSAREALLNAAQSMQDSYDENLSRALLNKRQRAITKIAIRYYLQDMSTGRGYTMAARMAYLLGVFEGELLDDAGYANAETMDQADE